MFTKIGTVTVGVSDQDKALDEFPGDHGGYGAHPAAFAATLREVLEYWRVKRLAFRGNQRLCSRQSHKAIPASTFCNQ